MAQEVVSVGTMSSPLHHQGTHLLDLLRLFLKLPCCTGDLGLHLGNRGLELVHTLHLAMYLFGRRLVLLLKKLKTHLLLFCVLPVLLSFLTRSTCALILGACYHSNLDTIEWQDDKCSLTDLLKLLPQLVNLALPLNLKRMPLFQILTHKRSTRRSFFQIT